MMRKQLIEQAAFDVATQVRVVEDNIEAALMEIAELQARMLKARAVARVGVATGHDALEHVAQALGTLVATRGAMADAHAALKASKDQVPGLRETSFGDAGECPPRKAALTELKIVA